MFNASEECSKHNRKISHFLDNAYVKKFAQDNNLEIPKLKIGRGNATYLDERFKPLLDWWLNRGYKRYLV